MDYRGYVRKRLFVAYILLLALLGFSLFYLSLGTFRIHLEDLLLLKGRCRTVLLNLRLPRVLSAILVGASLSLAGAVMQCLLRNPLASPFTLGISHGAMFGASFAVVVLGLGGYEGSNVFLSNPYVVVFFAFLGALLGISAILFLAKVKGLGPEAIVLSGVAIGSLFTAGATVIQYFANELQLSAIVYWSFGDLARPSWREIFVVFLLLFPSFFYFLAKSWEFNAVESGDEVAFSLGVDVERLRLLGVLLSSLIVSVAVAFVGVIGFVGLICPHMARLLVGGDYRFVIPTSAVMGALLLVASDALAKTVISPAVLPVGIVTSFLGCPTFLYLLVRGRSRVL